MKAVIMMGGYGTRLEPLTLRNPKALLPLGGVPSIMRILNQVGELGINETVISANQMQKKVEDFVKNGVRFIYDKTTNDKDKIGQVRAMKCVFDEVGYDDAIIISSDNYAYGLDLKSLIDNFKKNRRETNVFYNLDNKEDVRLFGIGVLDKSKRILEFQEKPNVEDAKSTFASTGFYLMTKEFLKNEIPDYISNFLIPMKLSDNTGTMLTHFVHKRELFGELFEGKWGDIGKPHTYIEGNKVAMGFNSINIVKSGAKKARIIPPVIIEENVRIGKNTTIGPYSHIMKNTSIGDNCSITGSIIFENVELGDNSNIDDSVVDGFAKIGKNSTVEGYSLIGYKAIIGESSKIIDYSRIWPFVEIESNSIIRSAIKWPIIESEKRAELVNSRYWE